jgi:hypothetical protein
MRALRSPSPALLDSSIRARISARPLICVLAGQIMFSDAGTSEHRTRTCLSNVTFEPSSFRHIYVAQTRFPTEPRQCYPRHPTQTCLPTRPGQCTAVMPTPSRYPSSLAPTSIGSSSVLSRYLSARSADATVSYCSSLKLASFNPWATVHQAPLRSSSCNRGAGSLLCSCMCDRMWVVAPPSALAAERGAG